MIPLTIKSFKKYVIAVNKLKKSFTDTESTVNQSGYGKMYNSIYKYTLSR
jgi:hypothetical protein